MARITFRYFAAAREAASGLVEETVTAHNLADAFTQVSQRHGREFDRIVGISSYLLNGQSLANSELDREISIDSTIDVLPPFAGG